VSKDTRAMNGNPHLRTGVPPSRAAACGAVVVAPAVVAAPPFMRISGVRHPPRVASSINFIAMTERASSVFGASFFQVAKRAWKNTGPQLLPSSACPVMRPPFIRRPHTMSPYPTRAMPHGGSTPARRVLDCAARTAANSTAAATSVGSATLDARR